MPATPLDTHQQLVAGDDCKAADGRALAWGPSATWPDLAGATLTMTVGHDQYNLYGSLPLVWTGTVPLTPDKPATVSLDVLGTSTSSLPDGEYDYQLTATLVNLDKVTLAIGKLTVWAAPGSLPLYPPAV